MSGKGNSNSGSRGSSRSGGSGTTSSNSASTSSPQEPTIITGWEHTTYANANTNYARERYAYLGKDEDTGEPEWVDYGPKGGR